MKPTLARGTLRAQRGLLRSILIYHAIPWRHRQLVAFYGQFIGPGDLCFDVGAHVGNRVRAWRALDARVVAFEPQPICMRFLRRWFGNDAQVTLVEEAVGAAPGSASLRISSATPTVTTLSREWIDAVQQTESFATVNWESEAAVHVITLDQAIQRFGRPAFCKIDIEGYEFEALRGLSQPIPALSIEYVPAALDIALACIERLEDLAEYEYNWSVGEEHRWQSPGWIPATAMRGALENLSPAANSGDLYARLCQP